ncbi:uncharacterized protein DSM5745_09431 [Aspergillus mulundensis]|uniref:Protein kinase domain-containing protein n=1 Tax=Aspergillus mulundensis TaxID=1810919 RepID=A0A3D8QVA1_9EURO|nr:hypothetical protein DSM5745_09431 [Aspergillus mulundensis]RDW65692.1 hypothetical protein DSM5745_09431 [Aspergillus mulundensis]
MSTKSRASTGRFRKGTKLDSANSGRYHIQHRITEATKPGSKIEYYRATRQGSPQKFTTIVVFPDKKQFDRQISLEEPLPRFANVTAILDTVPEHNAVVYPTCSGNLWQLIEAQDMIDPSQNPTRRSRQDILRCALHGLVQLHDRLKPNNVTYRMRIGRMTPTVLRREGVSVDATQIGSVRLQEALDAVVVPPGGWHTPTRAISRGIWQSPEVWCGARYNQSSDIFSFGTVLIYAMTNKPMIWSWPPERDPPSGADRWYYTLRQHIGLFGNPESLQGLLAHIGEDNIWHRRLTELIDQEKSAPLTMRRPLSVWGNNTLQLDLLDLAMKMTDLDPTKRITAREALAHPWFGSIESDEPPAVSRWLANERESQLKAKKIPAFRMPESPV